MGKLDDKIIKAGYSITTPHESEIKLLLDIPRKIKPIIFSLCQKHDLPVRDIIPVGSSQRSTFLPHHLDLDLFIRFETKKREILIEFTKKIIPQLADNIKITYEIRYAENPYGRIYLNEKSLQQLEINESSYFNSRKSIQLEIPVDLVSTIWISSAKYLASALKISGMARTPFHYYYLREKIKGLESEVRLFKYWCNQKKIYGQGGFTGLLTELLIIIFGSFIKILENAPNICFMTHDFHERPNSIVRNLFPQDQIIITDPIDPSRNTAGGIHGTIGKLKLKRFVEQANLAFTNPKFTWKGYEILPPFITIDVSLKKDIIIKNIDEKYFRFGRILSTIVNNFKTNDINLKEAEIIPLRNRFVLKIDNLNKKHKPRRGPPTTFHEHARKFKLLHSNVWEENGYLWTNVKQISAVEIITNILEDNQVIESFKINLSP